MPPISGVHEEGIRTVVSRPVEGDRTIRKPERRGGSKHSVMEALNRKGGTSRGKSSCLRVLERPPLHENGVRVYPDVRNANMSRMLVNTHIRLEQVGAEVAVLCGWWRVAGELKR
jgi:hypothetical protein